MKKFLHYLGIYLIILGVFTLALTRLPSLMGNNTMLLIGLLFIIAGIITHIRIIKAES